MSESEICGCSNYGCDNTYTLNSDDRPICWNCEGGNGNGYCDDCSYAILITFKETYRMRESKCMECFDKLLDSKNTDEDTIYGLELKELPKYLKKHTDPLKKEIEALRAENHLLKMKLKYRPYGEGFVEAKLHFEELIDKI